jgi:hypothetical protein
VGLVESFSHIFSCCVRKSSYGTILCRNSRPAGFVLSPYVGNNFKSKGEAMTSFKILYKILRSRLFWQVPVVVVHLPLVIIPLPVVVIPLPVVVIPL